MNLLWFQVRTFYCPSGRRDALFFLWKQMYTFIITNTDKKFKCAIMLLIRQSSTSKLQFIFGFNGCLRAIFPLLSFKNFLLYTWDEVVWLLILQRTCIQITSYSCPWINLVSAKATKCIPKCWQRSVRRNSNLNFIRVIKNSSFDQYSVGIYK